MSSPIRTLIKNNSHFAISAPNCLFTGNVFYQLRDLWNQQLQSFSTALLYQFNSNSLYHQISRIRLFQLQSNEGLHVSPLACWNRPYDNKSYKNLIRAMISLLKHDCIDINFKLNNTLLNRIKGGSLPLDSILTSTQLAQSMIMIKKYKLLFLDQFLATDGFSLLSWVEIISRSCYSTISLPSPKLPKIYNLVSSLVLDNPNNNIVKNIFRLTSNNLFFSPSLDVDINSKKREFVSVLHAQSDRPITGRVLRKYPADNSLACQHLVLAPRNNQILPQHVERSIVSCDGCDLNDLQLLDFLRRPRYKKGSPPLKSITCVQSCDPAHTIIIKKAKTPHPNKGTCIMTQLLKEILNSHKYRSLGRQSLRIQQQQQNIPVMPSISPPVISINYTLINNLIEQPFYRLQLQQLSTTFVNIFFNCSNSPNIYTDGSLIGATTVNCHMGIGWISPDLHNHDQYSFSAAIQHHPSLTRAELFALLTALIVCPPSSSPTIFLDSQAVIQGFHSLFNNIHTTRSIEKTPNFTIWTLIKHIVISLKLQVSFVKVKGHSDDFYNDKADFLAKQGCHLTPLTLNITSTEDMRIVLSFKEIPIESSSQKFWKDLCAASQFSEYLELNKNCSIKQQTSNKEISWSSIFLYLADNDNGNRSSTSFLQRSKKAFKIKILTEELPTLSKLEIRRPDIYKE